MKTKQTFAKALTLGLIVCALIAFAVWNVNRVSAFGEVEGKVNFGIVTLLPSSQNARLNFTRVDGSVEDPNIRPCLVEVTIFDANGQSFGTPDTFDLRPGIAVTRNVIAQGSTSIEGQFQFRATFKFIDPEDATRSRRCIVIPTLEVFSRATGGTLFMYPGEVAPDGGDFPASR